MRKGLLKKIGMILLTTTIVIGGVLIGSYEVKARELEETKPGEHGNCGAVNGDVKRGGIMLNTIIKTRYAEIYYTFNNGILTIDGTDIDIAIYDHDYARYHLMWEGYFEDCTNIKEVVINLEYISIGEDAFKGCTNLTKVTMPKIYYDIGSSAFEGCTSLESVIFPDGCHPENSGISRNVFKDCTSLTSITLPSRYTQIGSSAFEGCTSLTSITVPRQISEGAFRGCTNLKTVIFDEVCFIIPGIRIKQNEVDRSDKIEEYAVSEGNDIFYGCDNISTIIINKEYDFSRYVTEERTNEDINSLYIETMINSVRRNSPNVSTITIPTKYVKTIQDFYTENGEDIRIGAFTVTFDENGHGTAPEKIENMLCYDKISAPEEPIASGCTFEGWYKEAECTNAWDFDTEMTDDVTLYAKWTEHHGPSEWSKDANGHWCECAVERCEEIFDEAAHIWDDGVITTAPTVVGEGVKTYTCTACGFAREEPIDKLKVGPDNPKTNDGWGDIDDEDKNDFVEDYTVNVDDNRITVSGISDVTYTGSAKTFDIRVYKGTNLLREDTDYTVTYKNNTNVSTSSTSLPTVVIKGKGKYASIKETRTFAIKPMDISGLVVTNATAYVPSEGKVSKPVPKVLRKGKALKAGTDYKVEYGEAYANGYTLAGTYEIKLTGVGNYTGNLTSTYKLVSREGNTSIEKSTASGFKKSLKYNDGKAVTQSGVKIKIKKDNKTVTLNEGSDYTVSYANNIEAGTATMIVRAVNGSGYVGEKIFNYSIAGSPLSKTKITLKLNASDAKTTASFDYTGKRIKPVVEITTKGQNPVKLVEGVDYTLEYKKNINAGTAAIYIKGINKYQGTVKKTFKIKAVDLRKDVINAEIIPGTITKNASGKYVGQIEVTYNGRLLTEGKDYTLSFKNNAKPGLSADGKTAPTVVIKGKGNYAMTKSLTFDIVE